MRERILNKEITKEVKAMLPVIPKEFIRERGCSFCPYYAGTFEKAPRCVMAECAWDDEEEHFHPSIRQLIPLYKDKMEKAGDKFMAAKKTYEILLSMYKEEMVMEELEKDDCFGCCYSTGGPCVGICYKQLMGEGR